MIRRKSQPALNEMRTRRKVHETERRSIEHAREYSSIISALHALEKHLASSALRGEGAWKKRAHAALAVVMARLKEHCGAAESDGGILANAEITIGRNRAVSRAFVQHKRMLEEARSLLADLKCRASDPWLTPREVRRRAAHLANVLRAHQALEADIIIETCERDIGGGD
jgi:hypothetical protein